MYYKSVAMDNESHAGGDADGHLSRRDTQGPVAIISRETPCREVLANSLNPHGEVPRTPTNFLRRRERLLEFPIRPTFPCLALAAALSASALSAGELFTAEQ